MAKNWLKTYWRAVCPETGKHGSEGGGWKSTLNGQLAGRLPYFFNHEPAAAEIVAQTFPNVAPYRDMLETFQRPQETGVAEAVLRLPDGAYHAYMLLSDMERSLIGS